MTTKFGVTVVTANAGQDGLTDADYREIYDEVRGFDAATGKYAVSLDEFVALVGSAYSKAAWSKYHRGELGLNRVMRSELRRAVGLPVLPLTVGEAVAGVDEDATVVRVGDAAGGADLVRRVVLLAGSEPVTVSWNGTVSAWAGTVTTQDLPAPVMRHVTPVTRQRKGVFVPAGVFDRVNARRIACGLSWAEVLEAAEGALAAHDVSVADGAAGGMVGADVGQVTG